MKYSYDECVEASISYFNGDELAAKVFVDKYALRNRENELLEKTPDDMHKRIAKEFARIEKKKFKKPLTENQIYKYLKGFKKIIPQGSPMYGIGNPYQYVTISNCYVLPSPYDSYAGISYLDSQIPQISSRRGGVGWSISKLRPAGTVVKNAAKSTSGAISFMHRYSNTVREVCQAGRRGASLQSMIVRHPEILGFIKVKRNKVDVTGSNITVQFTDEFMKAVENNSNYDLIWPVSQEDADEMKLPFPVIKETVKAKDIWDEFIVSARDFAEPGACFIDRVHEESTCYHYGMKEISSNPCVVEGTLVNTPDGYKKVEDIKQYGLVSTVLGYEPVESIEVNQNCEVYEVEFSDGGKQKVTASHMYHVTRQKSQSKKVKPICVKNINIGDYVRVNPSKFITEDNSHTEYSKGLKAGVLLGDGCYTENSLSKDIIKIASNQTENVYNSNLKSLFGEENFNQDDPSKDSQSVNLILKSHSVNLSELGLEPSYCENKKINLDKVTNLSFAIGLLDGLLATDGNVNLKSNHPQLRWDTTSEELAQQIRNVLLYVGCHGFISSSDKQDGGTINGRKIVRKHTKYTITVSGESFRNYAKLTLISHLHDIKGDKLKQALINFRLSGNSWMAKVIKITKLDGKYTTYDLYCKNSDTWITSGYVQRGCGEQYLPAYACCRLIVILLLSYVKQPYTEDANFDFETFKQDVSIMQRLADDMVDLDIESIDKILNKIKSDPEPEAVKQIAIDLWTNIKNTTIRDRRTGCGFTGLGDTLAALGIKYGSEESITFCNTMQQLFKFSAYESSVDMAQELGPFPEYDKDIDIKSKFIQRIKEENPELYTKMTKFGRRNVTLLTIAPTGTVSCLTQTTSGLEPVFALDYTRRKKGNHNDTNFKVDFVDDNGDSWQEFTVFHKGLQDWMNVTGETDITKSPYYGATANEIDWVSKTRLQGVLQKHIDNSISVTTNLPNDVSYETVSKIYLESWRNGNKGCTVYRDGCRDGVLITDKSKTETKMSTAKRPKELPCDVYHISVKGQPYFVLVGLLNNKPYEVFAGKNGVVDKNVSTGVIIKRTRRQYKAIFEDDSELSPINAFLKDEEEALTRCISALLRHDVDISIIVHQLEKINGDMSGFAKSVLRALKKYIKDGTEVYGEECDNCKGKLIREEGCITCKNCGWSKC